MKISELAKAAGTSVCIKRIKVREEWRFFKPILLKKIMVGRSGGGSPETFGNMDVVRRAPQGCVYGVFLESPRRIDRIRWHGHIKESSLKEVPFRLGNGTFPTAIILIIVPNKFRLPARRPCRRWREFIPE